MAETLHPVVQLKFGNEDITQIPPEYLLEFIHTSTRGSIGRVTLTLNDPKYIELEKKILFADKRNGGGVLYRWGYPGKGLENGRWYSMSIREYVPTIGAGMRITLTGQSTAGYLVNRVEASKTYKGSVSTVALAVAKDMGYTDTDKIFIEPTDDSYLNEIPFGRWTVSNRSLFDLLNELRRLAKSKENPQGNYDFFITNSGEFHFHTQYYKPATKIKSFNVLVGDPTVSFSPNYNSQAIGQFASTVLGATYDPLSKQYKQKVMTRDTLALSTNQDVKNGRTTSSPFIESANILDLRKTVEATAFIPAKSVGHGGHCSGRQPVNKRAIQAIDQQEDAYKRMHRLTSGGVLELIGVPEYVDLGAADRHYDISVILPLDLKDGGNTLHWSSGRYFVVEVTHEITSNYRISVTLERPTMGEGPSPAKTKGSPLNQDIPRSQESIQAERLREQNE